MRIAVCVVVAWLGVILSTAITTYAEPAKTPLRIVSMAPHITETLFALGVGNKVVGVTDFCDYPKQAKEIAKVGGYFNPSYEAVVALQPDLVILLATAVATRKNIERLGIATVTVENESVAAILDSISVIGRAVGASKKARLVVDDIKASIDRVTARAYGKQRQKVLVSVGRSFGQGPVESLFVAAPASYYGDLLRLVGADNAYEGTNAKYPKLSGEGLFTLKPDVLIDIIPEGGRAGMSEAGLLKEWSALYNSGMVEKENIAIVTDEFADRPGPRVGLLLERFSAIIYP